MTLTRHPTTTYADGVAHARRIVEQLQKHGVPVDGPSLGMAIARNEGYRQALTDMLVHLDALEMGAAEKRPAPSTAAGAWKTIQEFTADELRALIREAIVEDREALHSQCRLAVAESVIRLDGLTPADVDQRRRKDVTFDGAGSSPSQTSRS